jgi:hypothetical protein
METTSERLSLVRFQFHQSVATQTQPKCLWFRDVNWLWILLDFCEVSVCAERRLNITSILKLNDEEETSDHLCRFTCRFWRT